MQKQFSGVRMGFPQDEDRIYTFLLNLNEENAIFELKEHKAREAIRSCLGPQSQGVIGIIEKNGVIQGSVGLRASQTWYADDWFLEEIWNFVHPDYRKSDYAKRLIEFAKWSSVNLNLPLVMGLMTKKRLEPKMRLYQRQMPQIGALFVWGKNFEDMYNQRKL